MDKAEIHLCGQKCILGEKRCSKRVYYPLFPQRGWYICNRYKIHCFSILPLWHGQFKIKKHIEICISKRDCVQLKLVDQLPRNLTLICFLVQYLDLSFLVHETHHYGWAGCYYSVKNICSEVLISSSCVSLSANLNLFFKNKSLNKIEGLAPLNVHWHKWKCFAPSIVRPLAGVGFSFCQYL